MVEYNTTAESAENTARPRNGLRMERHPADLPPAPRPRGGDDPRRGAPGGRPTPVGAPSGGRVPDQSAHGPEELPAAGRRGARGEEARDRHVRRRGGAQAAAGGRAPEVPHRAVAEGARHHPAARPDGGRAARGRRDGGRLRRPREGALSAMACIEARGLRKTFGTLVALDGIDLRVEPGRILGLIGPNGAGKTTALNAILGLVPYEGELEVLGRDPWTERERLMNEVCFISDVAVLPRWIRVSQALDFVAGVHPRFDRSKAEAFLAR